MKSNKKTQNKIKQKRRDIELKEKQVTDKAITHYPLPDVRTVSLPPVSSVYIVMSHGTDYPFG